jgi:hypothetical protein
VDPDVPDEQDDRFDVPNHFELCNPDDIAECDGDQHARKWQWHEMKKVTLLDEEFSVGAGARKMTWKVRFDITGSDVKSVNGAEEFPDVGVFNFDFATPGETAKMTTSGSANSKKKKHGKQKKHRINFHSLLRCICGQASWRISWSG